MRSTDEGFRFAGLSLIGLVVAGGLIFTLIAGALFGEQFFAPKFEQARRDTFKQSQAYNDGMVQELQAMRFQYIQARPEVSQAALKSLILHRAADYPEEAMPSDLRLFIRGLKGEGR